MFATLHLLGILLCKRNLHDDPVMDKESLNSYKCICFHMYLPLLFDLFQKEERGVTFPMENLHKKEPW